MTKASKFSAWQEANQTRREILISDYLIYLRKTRVRCAFVTDLAALVAKHIEESEGAPCNQSTLLRNPRYKAQLLSYMVRSRSPGSDGIDPSSISDPGAKALLITGKLEASNLRRELDRVNAYVGHLEMQVEEYRVAGKPRVDLPKHSAEASLQISDYELKFVRTCQVLRTLLDYLQVAVEVDAAQRQILDRSKRRNNVIVGAELAQAFFEWLASNQGSRS